MIKKFLKFILNSIGLEKVGHSKSVSLNSAFRRISTKNIPIKTVIDIGASNGCWTKVAKKYFPNASYFLVEANPYHLRSLENFKSSVQNVDFILAAAGDTDGEIYFDASDPFGGVAFYEDKQGLNNKVLAVKIDSICKDKKLQSPYLLKLDTHGFEIPIFEGAAMTLEKVNLVIVETYNFDIAKNSLRFHQICQYLEEKGFRCIDICEPLFREKDNALWQFDLFFMRADHSIFANNSWQ
ncbi:hypothetical protein Syn7502_03256 [Synechococcus sp. PCC 7502]|uniref:FkbM family methyltransferase n=1 Tax=Synechococcus sp. PCC 7502 TaxID=1173263 RepID=UPI00029FEA6F|nr:FkbM family methyltransferase [Synechococcus sp. PCC 7502]AFY75127.1 hypothetical protein Syn7502_03256 [Synechococcus sp. PCC 7502]